MQVSTPPQLHLMARTNHEVEPCHCGSCLSSRHSIGLPLMHSNIPKGRRSSKTLLQLLLALLIWTTLPSYATYHNSLTTSGAINIQSPASFHIFSDILSDISFDILSDISSDMSSAILSGISFDIFDILSDISSDILSDTSFDILSDISFDMLSDISSDIISDISSDQKACQKICQKECQKMCQKECQKICILSVISKTKKKTKT